MQRLFDDGATIEFLDPQWRPPAIAEYVAALRREIARAFAFPPAIAADPAAFAIAQRRAFEATAALRAEAVRLTALHSFPTALVRARVSNVSKPAGGLG